MNLIDAEVTEVLNSPILVEYPDIKFWKVDVMIVDEGGRKRDYLTFKTEKEAKQVIKGYRFQH